MCRLPEKKKLYGWLPLSAYKRDEVVYMTTTGLRERRECYDVLSLPPYRGKVLEWHGKTDSKLRTHAKKWVTLQKAHGSALHKKMEEKMKCDGSGTKLSFFPFGKSSATANFSPIFTGLGFLIGEKREPIQFTTVLLKWFKNALVSPQAKVPALDFHSVQEIFRTT